MPRSKAAPPPVTVAAMTYSAEEFDLILELMRMHNINTVAGVIHVALWNFARHSDLDPHIDAFTAARHARKRPAVPNRKRKAAPAVPVAV